jgi:Spy/CpxP family protein refolding chaperone
MLTAKQIQQIKELADANMSSRAIARATGHSRTTLRRVLQGKSDHRHRNANAAELTQESCQHDRAQHVKFSLRYARCKDCGRLVKHPCLACHIAQLKRQLRHGKAA